MRLSSFVGRESELAELAELVGKHRLVTLTGPGGGGKTRLAVFQSAMYPFIVVRDGGKTVQGSKFTVEALA